MRIFCRNKNCTEGNVLFELLLWNSNFKNTMRKRGRSSCSEVSYKKDAGKYFAGKNSQENNRARVSFLIELQAFDMQLYSKRGSSTSVFK